MIYFPSAISLPSYPLKEQMEDISIRSSFEDGSMLSRRKFTKGRTKYSVTWSKMPNSEYQTLKNFIINTVGYSAESFYWTYPLKDMNGSTVTKEVRITNVDTSQCSEINYWNVTLELTEV